MKRIVSISIGSSTRDHRVETEILGEKFLIERIGTNGDIGKAIEIVKDLTVKLMFWNGRYRLVLYGRKNKRYLQDQPCLFSRLLLKHQLLMGRV